MSDKEYIKDVVRSQLSTVPKTQAEIEANTGINRRIVRKAIGELRDEGMPICSGQLGFWIWDGSDRTLEQTVATMFRKGIKTIARARRMAGLPLTGQLTLDDLISIVEESA